MTKYALVTGASGGIGSAIARRLAEDGYSLYLHYYKNEQAIKELQQELVGKVAIIPVQADLTTNEGADVLWRSIEHHLDVIVYTAGKSLFGLVTDVTNQQLEEMTHLQLTSLYKLVNLALPSMIQRRIGGVVVISSIWGQVGASCEVLYSMLKGGQNTYVKALAKEIAPSGIRVNAIAPGAIATEMMGIFSEEEVREITEDIPLGRLGRPEEIANAVAFLLSPAASYMTGQIIGINGGWHC